MRPNAETPRRLRRTFISALAAAILAAILFSLSSCNRELVEMQRKYTYAYILLPDGSTVDGSLDGWKTFSNCDTIQVTVRGVTYLTHASRVTLCSEKPWTGGE